MSWSSGKDSAFALHTARQESSVEVVGLLTTVNAAADRVAMHAVRCVLLEAQAERLDLALHVVEIPSPCPNEVYETQMAAAINEAANADVTHMIFGDLFLADIRDYRQRMLTGTGIAPLFPLWQRRTDTLARAMGDAGIRAVVTCVDPTHAGIPSTPPPDSPQNCATTDNSPKALPMGRRRRRRVRAPRTTDHRRHRSPRGHRTPGGHPAAQRSVGPRPLSGQPTVRRGLPGPYGNRE